MDLNQGGSMELSEEQHARQGNSKCKGLEMRLSPYVFEEQKKRL